MSDPIIFESSEDFCVVCGKPARGISGYSRLLHEDRMYALCCPLCMETFQKKPDYYAAVWLASHALHLRKSAPGDV
jgi:hypothetical protein